MELCFASDNYSGANPEILAALAEVNQGYDYGYGHDSVTTALKNRLQDLFGAGYDFYPCLTGTGANIISMLSASNRFGAVICAETAHIMVSESTSVNAIAGLATKTIPTSDGKITPQQVESCLPVGDNEHGAQPQLITISQPTECGTVYTQTELAELVQYAHAQGLLVHLDGSRLPMAAEYLQCSLAEISTDIGIDIISLGGTKSGILIGEVIIAKSSLPVAANRKFTTQLASKMRFISAQLLALYGENELYKKNAHHANAMTQLLKDNLEELTTAELEYIYPVETNAIFAKIPPAARQILAQKYHFYDWDYPSIVRWMCSFDTPASTVMQFARDITSAIRSTTLSP